MYTQLLFNITKSMKYMNTKKFNNEFIENKTNYIKQITVQFVYNVQ